MEIEVEAEIEVAGLRLVRLGVRANGRGL